MVEETIFDQHVSWSITHLSNAYTSKEITLPRMKPGYYPVFTAVEVEIETASSGYLDIDADAEYFQWQLTDEEQSAMLMLDDVELICKDGFYVIQYGTAASGWDRELIRRYEFVRPLVYPHEKIYCGCIIPIAITPVSNYRLHYFVRKVDDWMLANLLKKK